jgi:hypothetical protein
MLVGEANSLFAFVQERKKIIATGKNHAKSVKLAHILGKQIATNVLRLCVRWGFPSLKPIDSTNFKFTENDYK